MLKEQPNLEIDSFSKPSSSANREQNEYANKPANVVYLQERQRWDSTCRSNNKRLVCSCFCIIGSGIRCCVPVQQQQQLQCWFSRLRRPWCHHPWQCPDVPPVPTPNSITKNTTRTNGSSAVHYWLGIRNNRERRWWLIFGWRKRRNFLSTAMSVNLNQGSTKFLLKVGSTFQFGSNNNRDLFHAPLSATFITVGSNNRDLLHAPLSTTFITVEIHLRLQSLTYQTWTMNGGDNDVQSTRSLSQIALKQCVYTNRIRFFPLDFPSLVFFWSSLYSSICRLQIQVAKRPPSQATTSPLGAHSVQCVICHLLMALSLCATSQVASGGIALWTVLHDRPRKRSEMRTRDERAARLHIICQWLVQCPVVQQSNRLSRRWHHAVHSAILVQCICMQSIRSLQCRTIQHARCEQYQSANSEGEVLYHTSRRP